MSQTIEAQIKKPWYQRGSIITLIVIGIIIVLGGGSFISTNNKLVSQQQDVDQQLGQVQNVLQRRADLIPNLVNTIKGQQKQEKSVYSAIADARKNYYGAQNQYNQSNDANDKVKALGQQERALNILVGSVKEAYPKLDSSQNTQALMVELEGSENRISVERQKYNQAVRTYNTTVQKFPGSLIAGMTNHKPANYFNADTNAQHVPQVKF